MKRFLPLTTASLILTACATTDPGSGAALQYDLPKTNASASLTMTLEKCPTSNDDKLKIEASLSIASKAGARGKPVLISGSDLASVRTKRAVTVSVDDNGVISGVNASSEDRTAAIIVNTLSTVTTLAGALLRPAVVGGALVPAKVLQCKKETLDRLEAVDALRGQIRELRADLSKAVPPRKRSEIAEDINALAAEIARLKTGPLRRVLSASVPLGNEAASIGGSLEFNYHILNKEWFEIGPPPRSDGVPTPESEIGPLTKEDLNNLFKVTWNSEKIASPNALPVTQSHKLKKCKLEMKVPAQTRGKILLKATGEAIAQTKSTSLTMPISQWGTDDTICLSTGFAENRTVAIQFDTFGQRKSFAWTSEAQAETVSSALSGVATSATAFKTAVEGPSDVDNQKAAIDRVTTQIQFNNAQLCEQAAREGATACPAPNADG